jgi:hypothetical protein
MKISSRGYVFIAGTVFTVAFWVTFTYMIIKG